MTPILVALVLAVLVAAAAGAVVLWTALGRSPLERRPYEPLDEPAEGYPGCFGCALAASAGDGYLRLHLASEHPERKRIRGERRAA